MDVQSMIWKKEKKISEWVLEIGDGIIWESNEGYINIDISDGYIND